MNLNGMAVPFAVSVSLLGRATFVDFRGMANWRDYDFMALASLGIFAYDIPGTEKLPGRHDYLLADPDASQSSPPHDPASFLWNGLMKRDRKNS